MGELTWMIDTVTGNLVVDGMNRDQANVVAGDLLPEPVEIGCARPIALAQPPIEFVPDFVEYPTLRIGGTYHDSLIEGPGRRSVVRVQGCPIHCPGCWVPETWDPTEGRRVSTMTLAHELLDPAHERDGITILGGEPFAQPRAVQWLIYALKIIAPENKLPHLVIYSGYTWGVLKKRAASEWSVDKILNQVDLLIEGPYIAKQAPGGRWTGSRNQRVIDVKATHVAGHIVLYQEEDSRG